MLIWRIEHVNPFSEVCRLKLGERCARWGPNVLGLEILLVAPSHGFCPTFAAGS